MGKLFSELFRPEQAPEPYSIPPEKTLSWFEHPETKFLLDWIARECDSPVQIRGEAVMAEVIRNNTFKEIREKIRRRKANAENLGERNG